MFSLGIKTTLKWRMTFFNALKFMESHILLQLLSFADQMFIQFRLGTGTCIVQYPFTIYSSPR